MPGSAEPADAEVEVALAGFFVAGRGAVGFVVVARVLECDSVPAFEFVVVPLCNLGVRKERVMAAEEAGFDAAGDVVGGWIVLPGWVARILPVAVLGLVDGEPLDRPLVMR